MQTNDKRKEFASLRTYFDEELPKECGNCGSGDDLQIHHVVPLTLGGNNVITNLVRLCTECHSKAHGGMELINQFEEVRRDNARNGRISSGRPPLGYLYKDGEWEVDESTAWIVRYIFRMRFGFEYSTTHIANALTHMAIPTVNGASKWTHPVIKRIIDNPRYLGESVYDGKSYGKLIPPIIDGELAEAKRRFEKKYEGTRLKPKAPPLMA